MNKQRQQPSGLCQEKGASSEFLSGERNAPQEHFAQSDGVQKKIDREAKTELKTDTS
jgi:hypothetical protein